MLAKVKSTLGLLAPLAARALGGPLGGLAYRTISEALTGTPDADEASVEEIIASGSPEVMLQLKQAEQQFALAMRDLDVDLERIHADDRASARRRQAETKDRAPTILAAAVVVGFFAVLLLLVFADVPDAARAPLNIMLGALGGLLTQIGNFFYGSSAGSSRKNETIERLLAEREARP